MKNHTTYAGIVGTIQSFTNRSEAFYGSKTHACGYLEGTLAQVLEELINSKKSQHSEYATMVLRRFTDIGITDHRDFNKK